MRPVGTVVRAFKVRFLGPAALFAAGLLTGCTPQATPDGSTTDMATKPVKDFAMIRDLIPPPMATVMGVVKDEAGNVIKGLTLQGCSAATCLTTVIGMDGGFVISGLALTHLSVKLGEDETSMPRRGEAMVPLVLAKDGEVVDVGTIYAPTMGPGALVAAMAGAQTLSVGDGMMLTVVRGDLVAPLGGWTDSNSKPVPPFIIARRVTADHRAKTFDVGTDTTVIDSYSMMPFALTSKTPIGVTLTLPAKETPGTVVHLRTYAELDGTPNPVVNGTVGQDGLTVTVANGTGLNDMTWIIVSK